MRAMLRPASVVAVLAAIASPAAAGGKANPPNVHHKPAGIRPAHPQAAPVVLPSPAVVAPQRPAAPPPVFLGGGPTVVVVVPPPVVQPLAAPRPVRPASFNVLDPYAIVSRAPSGRVVVTNPAWIGGAPAPVSSARPYAPPTFQIIGSGMGRHMRGPVHLVHGVAPAAERPTGPKVIWLREPADGKGPLKPSG